MLCCTKYNKRRKIYGKIKKLLALILSICVICTVSVMSVSAANTDDDNDTSASSTITVHYYCEEGTAHNLLLEQSSEKHQHGVPRR